MQSAFNNNLALEDRLGRSLMLARHLSYDCILNYHQFGICEFCELPSKIRKALKRPLNDKVKKPGLILHFSDISSQKALKET